MGTDQLDGAQVEIGLERELAEACDVVAPQEGGLRWCGRERTEIDSARRSCLVIGHACQQRIDLSRGSDAGGGQIAFREVRDLGEVIVIEPVATGDGSRRDVDLHAEVQEGSRSAHRTADVTASSSGSESRANRANRPQGRA